MKLFVIIMAMLLAIAACGVCIGVAVADYNDKYVLPAVSFIDYNDTIVSVGTVLTDGRAEFVVIFVTVDFFSEELFKFFFERVVSNVNGDDPVDKVKGYGLVNGEGYFGEWTPARGYRYYWNT